MIRARFLLATVALLLVAQSTATLPPRVAIIIDDLGYEMGAGRRAIDLPGPLAYAILPATPRGAELARLAHERGKEVLLHLPLEAAVEKARAEPGAILLDMSRAAFGDAFVRRIVGPFSVMRWALCSSLSQIASAWFGSPMTACQSLARSRACIPRTCWKE